MNYKTIISYSTTLFVMLFLMTINGNVNSNTTDSGDDHIIRLWYFRKYERLADC
jgi:hypothetical protein